VLAHGTARLLICGSYSLQVTLYRRVATPAGQGMEVSKSRWQPQNGFAGAGGPGGLFRQAKP